MLSLDIGLETTAEELLAGVVPASALVAIRPSTGEVLAAANGPGNGGLNLATFGQFAPGSTFKTVSSLALLRAGLTPRARCRARGASWSTARGSRTTPTTRAARSATSRSATAVANSCNTAFISQASKLSGTEPVRRRVSLGIGLDHDLGFPAYFGKTDPDPAARRGPRPS